MIARRAELLRDAASAHFLAKQRDRISRCLDALEGEAATLEDELTRAQIGAAVACGYMDFRYPADAWRERRPRLAQWYAGFATRPSMLQTVPAETPQRDAAT